MYFNSIHIQTWETLFQKTAISFPLNHNNLNILLLILIEMLQDVRHHSRNIKQIKTLKIKLTTCSCESLHSTEGKPTKTKYSQFCYNMFWKVQIGSNTTDISGNNNINFTLLRNTSCIQPEPHCTVIHKAHRYTDLKHLTTTSVHRINYEYHPFTWCYNFPSHFQIILHYL